MDKIVLTFHEFNLIQSGDGFIREYYEQLPKYPDLGRNDLYEKLESTHEKLTGKRRYSSFNAFYVCYTRYLNK